MKFRQLFRPLWIIIGSLALAALACGSTPDPNAPTHTPRPTATPKINVSLKVINETQNSLCYLLVAPSDEEFEKEYLDGTEIAPGEVHTVSGFDVGEYNVKVHDCDQNMVNALYFVDMHKDEMTWTIKEATLKIANDSSQPMCELYISPSSAPESAWGPSQLSDGETLEPDMYASFFIAQGKWDIRLVPCDESIEPTTEIGLQVEGDFTYTISD